MDGVVDIEKVAVSSSLRLLEPKRTIESRAKRSSINLDMNISNSLSFNTVETKVFHNEDGNPARANIKQALGRIISKMEMELKFPVTRDIKRENRNAQDTSTLCTMLAIPLQDDVRLCLGNDLKKGHDSHQDKEMSEDEAAPLRRGISPHVRWHRPHCELVGKSVLGVGDVTTTFEVFPGDILGVSPSDKSSLGIPFPGGHFAGEGNGRWGTLVRDSFPSDKVGPTYFSVNKLVPPWHIFPDDMLLGNVIIKIT
ncbi:hypothetical protein Tco_1517557 [Tanacetum coccineum]